jgi:transcriptional regulator with XRE-family HTH domain
VANETNPKFLSEDLVIARLKALRRAQKMSQAELAERSGVSPHVLANLDSARRQSLGLDEAVRICEALGVDLRVVLVDAPMHVEI